MTIRPAGPDARGASLIRRVPEGGLPGSVAEPGCRRRAAGIQAELEWTAGFGNRYGIVYVDFKTQKRTPKMSAHWFREAARHNAVV